MSLVSSRFNSPDDVYSSAVRIPPNPGLPQRPLLLVPLELMHIDVCLSVYAMHLLPFKDVFSDFCEKIVEVFMEDFSVYGKPFDDF